MSIFQRVGAAVVQNLMEQQYYKDRRIEVDGAWAQYLSTVIEREENGSGEIYRYGYEELHRQTDAYIRREAERWAKTCRKHRIYKDDFESDFRFTVIKAAIRYDGQAGSFFDYLRGSIKNAGRDLVRDGKLKKNSVNHTAKNIEEPKVRKEVEKRRQSPSAEHLALLKMTVEDMAADSTLTDQERALFLFLRKYPDATLQEMADHLEVRDRKQASRLKNRLAVKLKKYL